MCKCSHLAIWDPKPLDSHFLEQSLTKFYSFFKMKVELTICGAQDIHTQTSTNI